MEPPSIRYQSSSQLSADDFIDLLRRSTLGERRPIEDRARIEAMLSGADVICTAWDGDKLVGIARSVTDFAYCCYLSDLAVDEAYQRRGIGKELIRLTQAQLHPQAKLILLSAPAAVDYYPKVGFERHPSAWVIGSRSPVL
jgi:ribosomal protein S18 acetylase RimI-like enzyme